MQTGTKRTWRHISNVSHWFEMSGVGLLSIPAQCCSKYSVIIFCCFVIACIFYLSLNLNLTPKPALKEMWRQMRTAHNAKKPTDGASISKEVKEAVTHYSSLNQFKVAAAVKGRSMSLGRADITCELRARVPLRVIKAGDGPFSGEQWEKSLPSRGLEETLGPLKTCAVVMSSGALRRSSLGMEIDSHDAVLRFNAAPTEGHSRDVGSKTTLRIVNSQLMVTQKARFLQDALFNTGVLIMWDPAPYSKDLHEWYRNPDFNFTETYQDYHRLHPRQPFYILSPSMQWELWDILQEYSPTAIQPNPPSSGMQGIIVMLSLCDRISVYEFLPSHRKSDLCHYFEDIHNWQCTQGHYHPLSFEKNLIKHLNQGGQEDVVKLGKVTLNGFSQERCRRT